MDTCEHKGRTSHPHCPVLKGPSGGVSRRERGGDREKGPRPGPNGGNSAEVKPSFCPPRIKEAFERQRVFLFRGGPSKLQAMLVVGCVVVGEGGGGWDRSVDTGRRQSYLLQGKKYATARVLEGGQRIICLWRRKKRKGLEWESKTGL